MWTVSVKTGQSELNGAEHTNARTHERTHTRTPHHHVTLNLYIDFVDMHSCLNVS